MNLSEIKDHFKKELSGIYPTEEIQSFFEILSEKYLGLKKIEVVLYSGMKISEDDSEKFQNALYRLKKHEPIQYIIGETEFYGLPFKVNKHTLIPRPETEELVNWILNGSDFKIQDSELLDIGTGSGCIAISLAKNLQNMQVSALDISEEALKIAMENAALNNVNINFFQTDILKTRNLPMCYDIIVSNPPYVRELEKNEMQKNVLDFEPALALFVENEDPLLFYRKISQLAKNHLKPYGKLFFEINEYLSNELISLLKSEGFQNIEIKKDIFGKDRMLKCQLNDQTK